MGRDVLKNPYFVAVWSTNLFWVIFYVLFGLESLAISIGVVALVLSLVAGWSMFGDQLKEKWEDWKEKRQQKEESE